MDDAVGLELRKIIVRYGSDVSEDPRRVEALLRDLSGEHRREIFVLVGAAREGVPAELLASGVTVSGLVLNERLSQMLQDNLGLTEEMARWAVATWASALGATASAPIPSAARRGSETAGRAVPDNASVVDSAPEPTALVVAPLGAAHYRTISAAIAAAEPGARILVRPGVYAEAVVIDRPVELLADGPAEDIVIETAVGSCVLMKVDDAVVRGFTLRRRATEEGGAEHYAVEILRGRPILEACDISSESRACVAVSGAGTAPTIRTCRIHDGRRTGILIWDRARPTIEDCDVCANIMAGVEISGSADPLIRRCLIRHGQAAGVMIHGKGLGTFEDCDIGDNAYAGVSITSGGNPTVRACRVNNGLHAGILSEDEGLGTVRDSDIWANKMAGVVVRDRGQLTLRGNKVRDGLANGFYSRAAGGGIIEDCEFTGNAEPAIRIEPGSGIVEVRGCVIEETETALLTLQHPIPAAIPGSPEARPRIAQLLDDAKRAAESLPGSPPDRRKREPTGLRDLFMIDPNRDWDAKMQALRAVATALAGTDPDGAEGLARSITDEIDQAKALASVAAALASTDPDRAERLAWSITNEDMRASALADLAKALAVVDLDRAERVAWSVTDQASRASALEGVARALAHTDPDRAEQIIKPIAGTPDSAYPLRNVAVALARTAPDQAERLVKSIVDFEVRNEALAHIARMVAKSDPDRAERLARLITDTERKAASLGDLAEELGDTDLERAERVARSISDQALEAKVKALSRVAAQLAHGQARRAARLIRAAERLARSSRDEYARTIALADVAQALAVTDPDQAERLARWAAESAASGASRS